MTHTPGPWETRGFSSDRFITIGPSNSSLAVNMKYLSLVPINENAMVDMIQFVDNDNKFSNVNTPELSFLHEECLANARLIAAAPELLDWLKKAEQMAEQQFRGDSDIPLTRAWSWLSENCQKVIAKAEGK